LKPSANLILLLQIFYDEILFPAYRRKTAKMLNSSEGQGASLSSGGADHDVNLRTFPHDLFEKQAPARQLYLLLARFQMEHAVKVE
jgi:hypothetical protein